MTFTCFLTEKERKRMVFMSIRKNRHHDIFRNTKLRIDTCLCHLVICSSCHKAHDSVNITHSEPESFLTHKVYIKLPLVPVPGEKHTVKLRFGDK